MASVVLAIGLLPVSEYEGSFLIPPCSFEYFSLRKWKPCTLILVKDLDLVGQGLPRNCLLSLHVSFVESHLLR